MAEWTKEEMEKNLAGPEKRNAVRQQQQNELEARLNGEQLRLGEVSARADFLPLGSQKIRIRDPRRRSARLAIRSRSHQSTNPWSELGAAGRGSDDAVRVAGGLQTQEIQSTSSHEVERNCQAAKRHPTPSPCSAGTSPEADLPLYESTALACTKPFYKRTEENNEGWNLLYAKFEVKENCRAGPPRLRLSLSRPLLVSTRRK